MKEDGYRIGVGIETLLLCVGKMYLLSVCVGVCFNLHLHLQQYGLHGLCWLFKNDFSGLKFTVASACSKRSCLVCGFRLNLVLLESFKFHAD